MQGNVLEGYSLSPQQRHLWLLQQADQRAPYLARCTIRIDGALDSRLLVTALQQIVAQHEILRTTFQHLPGMTTPLQVIGERAELAVPEHDLSGYDALVQTTTVTMILHELSEHPFDLAAGPLLRCALTRLKPDRHLLLIVLPAL